jgi:lysophospholipase L1-like esterase
VVTAASELGHARAQARLLSRGERLPALGPLPKELPPPPPALLRVGLAASPEEGSAGELDLTALEPIEPLIPIPMPGYFVPLTEPARGHALASFHAALAALAEERNPDGKVRVAMYGASGTASDLAVGYLRAYLQARFGDGGPGFVPLLPLARWYRHSEVVVEGAKDWRKEHAQIYKKGRQDGHYGLLGASFSATAGKLWAQVSPKPGSVSSEGVTHAELFFLRQPAGGSFLLQVDGTFAVTVSTAAEAFEPGYYALTLAPGPHTIRIETLDEAEVRVFGVVLERPEPGVVVDVLGIDGTRGANHLKWNETLWADNLRRRAPDLYTLSYGTNESVDASLSIPLYAEDLREQLRRFQRALPDASCLLLGPADFPIVAEDQILPRPVLREIIEAQRQVASEEGCGFWDGMLFMGGELSMASWVSADPPLAREDYLHFNRRGSARKAMALADALMYGFDALRARAAPEGLEALVIGP